MCCAIKRKQKTQQKYLLLGYNSADEYKRHTSRRSLLPVGSSPHPAAPPEEQDVCNKGLFADRAVCGGVCRTERRNRN